MAERPALPQQAVEGGCFQGGREGLSWPVPEEALQGALVFVQQDEPCALDPDDPAGGAAEHLAQARGIALGQQVKGQFDQDGQLEAVFLHPGKSSGEFCEFLLQAVVL